jgi:hypothetical protein
MKNKEIIALNNGLSNCGNLKCIKFAFAVSKNIKSLSAIIEPLSETIKKLQDEHAKKDKDGEKITIKKGEIDEIQMVDLKKFEAEYKELMEVENEITLHKVKIENLPEDITVAQLNGIMEIIEE